jgi:uncharacterized protein (DUF2384 family)
MGPRPPSTAGLECGEMTTAPVSSSGPSEFWSVAPELFNRLQDAGAVLAVSSTVPPEVETALRDLSDALPADPESLGAADPYLISALYASTMKGLEALNDDDPSARRRELRIPFERARQTLRGLLADEPVMDDRSAKEISQWLMANGEIPRIELARVLGISEGTLRRWANPEASASPRAEEARRIRVLAKVVNQLRWSLSPVWAIQWLERPHPSLKGEAPMVLLADSGPEGGPRLMRLANGTRSMTLT